MKNNIYFRYVLIICLLIAVAFTACKPKQKIVNSTSPVEKKSHKELLSDVVANQFTYRTFSARLNIGLNSGTRSLSSKANIRIVKDEAIQISVQPLFGVEMFRFYIEPDTLFLLDRMNKRYVLESIKSLKELYPVGFDYFTLQSLFTNALFVSGKKDVDVARDANVFQYEYSEQCYRIEARDVASGIDYSFILNGDDRITFTHLMRPDKQQYLQWEYRDFVLLNNAIFPHKMNMAFSSDSREINTELSFSNVVINEPVSLSFNVPSNYSKVSIEDILRILSPQKKSDKK